MTNNYLDLSNKPAPRIIERVVFKRRSWHVELAKVALGIVVATGVVYAVSKADENLSSKSFSAIGVISSMSGESLSIEKANGSDGGKGISYSFAAASISKLETSDYSPINLSDLRVGDRVIVQGTDSLGGLTATRIISFSSLTSSAVVLDVATSTATLVATSTASSTISGGISIEVATSTVISTATTTEDVIIASSTVAIATSTATSTTPSSSGSEVIEVIDVATSSASTTDAVATDVSSTTDSVISTSTSPSSVAEPESQPASDVIVPVLTEPVPDVIPTPDSSSTSSDPAAATE